MDHYQTHSHPSATGLRTSSVHSTTSQSSKNQWAKEWQHMCSSHPLHHFHFPAVSMHDFTSRIANASHLAQQPALVAPWVPDADIRETKLAYHIEIEVPYTTDKGAMVISWLSPNTLIVRGNIQRPNLTLKPTEDGKTLESQDPADAPNPAEESQAPLQTANGTSPKAQTANGASSVSPWEELDLEWCALTQTNEKNQLANRGGLTKRSSQETHPTNAITDTPTLLLSERKVGPWQRTFTLPLDVDMKASKASLDYGLLSIELPKRDMAGEEKVKIDID